MFFLGCIDRWLLLWCRKSIERYPAWFIMTQNHKIERNYRSNTSGLVVRGNVVTCAFSLSNALNTSFTWTPHEYHCDLIRDVFYYRTYLCNFWWSSLEENVPLNLESVVHVVRVLRIYVNLHSLPGLDFCLKGLNTHEMKLAVIKSRQNV